MSNRDNVNEQDIAGYFVQEESLPEQYGHPAGDRYRALFDSIAEGYCLLEAVLNEFGQIVDYWYRDCNPAFSRLTGIPNPVGRRMSELPRNAGADWPALLEEVYGTGIPLRLEYPVPGSDQWYSCDISRVGGAGSRLIAVIYDDITERKSAEEQQAFLLNLSDAIRPLRDPLAIQETAMHILGSYLAVNRAYYTEALSDGDTLLTRTGYFNDAPSLVGTLKFSEFDTNIRESYLQGKTIVVNDILAGCNISEMARAAFERVQFRAGIGVPLIKDGQLLAIVTAHQTTPRIWTKDEVSLLEEVADRTWAAVERAKAEEALRVSEGHRRLAMEAAGIYTASIEIATGQVTFSENASRVFGYQLEKDPQNIYARIARAVVPEDADGYRAAIEAVMRGEGDLHREIRIINPVTRHHIWIEVHGTLIRSEDGSPQHVVLVGRNIAARKRREANLECLAEIGKSLVEMAPPDEIVRSVGAQLAAFLDVPFACIVEFNESLGSGDVKYEWKAAGITDLAVIDTIAAGGAEVNAGDKRTGKPVVVEDARGLPGALPDHGGAQQIRSFVKVPLRVSGDWRTCLVVADVRPRSWQPDEVELVEELAHRIYPRIQRARAEEALRESEEKYRTLFHSIDEGFCTIQVLFEENGHPCDYLFLDVNPAFEKHTGLFDVTGKRVRDLVPGHEQYWFDIYGSVAKTGEPVRFEEKADALGRIYDVNAFRIGRPEDHKVGVLFNDVTVRRKTEEALRISEERYRVALQSAEMAAWDWDVAADRLVWNDQHFFAFGIQPQTAAMSLSFFMGFVHPEDAARAEAELHSAVATGGVFSTEYRIRRADNGEVRWMSGFGRAVTLDAEGRARRMVGVMYDITRRKGAEEQKEEFIGIASHELRTPLTSIKAYAEVLQDMFLENGDGRSAGLMGKMDGQIDRLAELVRSLLDATRIREGRLELNPKPFDLDELLQERCGEMQHMSSQKIEISGGGRIIVTADRERIGQVVTNLLANAIKYSPGADKIIVRTQSEEGRIRVAVQDFGVGMSEGLQARVFDRFFRADEAGAGIAGLGLGLYISAEIVRRHGGEIWAESRTGEGSIFHFTLPG